MIQYTFSLDEIDTVAAKIIQQPFLKKVLLFYADMGVGKTTFINALCKQLGVIDTASSPTFSLVNEYLTKNNDSIYHFDLYRLKNEIEAYDMGLDEYFYSGNWCFIEWPDKAPNLIPFDHAVVTLKIDPSQKRILELTQS